MSCVVRTKSSNICATKASSVCLPKLSSHVHSKQSFISTTTIKTKMQVQLISIASRDDLDDIVNNLSIIVQRSEQSLTPKSSLHSIPSIRRTSSLQITNRQQTSTAFFKPSSSNHETLTSSNLDASRINNKRSSIRNTEIFSGIKCSLPSGRSTIPQSFKGLQKHTTPTSTKQINMSSSLTDNQITPIFKNEKVKSPWRLRFEKILNHQELTPLSPPTESIAFKPSKTSLINKDIGTPSFRLSTRRISKVHSTAK